MPHHHGSSGTSAGVSQGTSSTSGGQGRQDPEGGYAPEHKYSKTSKQMAAQGPQYQTGRSTGTGGKSTIDVKKTTENIAIGQGAKYMGLGPYSMLVAPTIRWIGNKFNRTKEPTLTEKTAATEDAPFNQQKKMYDWGPTEGDGQQQYPPWWYDNAYAKNIVGDEELDIDTSTGNMEDWVQRFRLADAYRQHPGTIDKPIRYT